MIFEKYHALGNDYLVYNPSSTNHEFSCEETVRICHRNFGLGSDGILVGPLPSDNAEFGLRILNPDGSEAEKSGNGLRIFARYLRDTKLVNDQPFTVDTLGGVVTCAVSGNKSTISVEMER
jgi:diaminopimelate epimerase